MKPKHKKNDIVLVKSIAGDEIPHIHVRLKTYEYVPRDGSWGGYGGWLKVGDLTFVHDGCIVEKEQS